MHSIALYEYMTKIPKVKKNPCTAQVWVFPSFVPDQSLYGTANHTESGIVLGMGSVVRAIATELKMSAQLMKNMILWYIVDSLFSEIRIR